MTDGSAAVLVLRMVISLGLVLLLVALFSRYLSGRQGATKLADLLPRFGGSRTAQGTHAAHGAQGTVRGAVHGARGLRRAPRRRPIEVLGRHQFTRSASIQLVRVGDQVHLLGVSDAQVNLLDTLDPSSPQVAALIDARAEVVPDPRSVTGSDASALASYRPRPELSGRPAAAISDAPSGVPSSRQAIPMPPAIASLQANPLTKLVPAKKFDEILGRATERQVTASDLAVEGVVSELRRRGGRHRG